MTINRNNYESYLIDFIDGTLSPELKEELMQFLRQNPDIADEAEGLSEIRIVADTYNFSYPKEMLRRSGRFPQLHMTEADYLCIAELEGDITPSESALLQDLKSKYQPIKKLSSIYNASRLVPEIISFPQKEQLKRSVRVITLRLIYVTSAVAAAGMMVFLIGSLLLNRQMVDSTEMMAVQSPVTLEQPQLQQSQPLAVQEEIPKKTAHRQSFRNNRDDNKTVEEGQNSSYIDDSSAPQPLAMQLPKPVSDIPHGVLHNGPHPRNDIPVESAVLSTAPRELTLTDLAAMGLRRLAKGVGIDVEVRENPDQTKRIAVESKFLAFSATILPKEE